MRRALYKVKEHTTVGEMMSAKSVNRTVKRIAIALAALLTLSAPATAFAADAPSPPVRAGSSDSAQDRVAAFYSAYIDARSGEPDTSLANALREHYLTKEFRVRLESWEHSHHVDGILRAQNTPRAWQVTYDNSGAGHTWTRVRLTWGDDQHPTYTYLSVQSDLSTKLISDIKQEDSGKS
ncbi:hypothetical protein GCM10010359_04120 [Streptomyces morookaense]|nr:hypothetical protein GCM10010359_04120 [Streptomyces morookaense]